MISGGTDPVDWEGQHNISKKERDFGVGEVLFFTILISNVIVVFFSSFVPNQSGHWANGGPGNP